MRAYPEAMYVDAVDAVDDHHAPGRAVGRDLRTMTWWTGYDWWIAYGTGVTYRQRWEPDATEPVEFLRVGDGDWTPMAKRKPGEPRCPLFTIPPPIRLSIDAVAGAHTVKP